MKSFYWDEKGILGDGRFLSNLRYADNIALFKNSPLKRRRCLLREKVFNRKAFKSLRRRLTCTSDIPRFHSMNTENDMKSELDRRRRAAIRTSQGD
ncbi:unnamed protein product [Heligmosomoides polygyrus]|uniref:Reverse transcriptase domain-containing protein n=1 Tax=Heligmosomoides polygyrus TaxID=6339 RepID=A0A183F5K5_HELPZ|nr:unnamed protein product [Heligmosomoides polygyrus]